MAKRMNQTALRVILADEIKSALAEAQKRVCKAKRQANVELKEYFTSLAVLKKELGGDAKIADLRIKDVEGSYVLAEFIVSRGHECNYHASPDRGNCLRVDSNIVFQRKVPAHILDLAKFVEKNFSTYVSDDAVKVLAARISLAGEDGVQRAIADAVKGVVDARLQDMGVPHE